MSFSLPLRRAEIGLAAADQSLAGRSVLVTGAYGGLGRAASIAAAKAGASVVLLGRKAAALEPVYDEIMANGWSQPAIFPMDLAGAAPEDFDALADSIEREFGRLDGIIHAAAAFEGLKPLEQQKPDEWRRIQNVVLTAPFLMQRSCTPLLKQSRTAAIVHVFDDPGRMQNAFWGSYGIAKSALAAMVAIAHQEGERSCVRMHGLLPAPMRTQLRRMAWFGEDTMQWPLPDATGEAAAFLLTDAAEEYRGQVLDLRPDEPQG
ncbi:MAG: SDR family NAD(P)-dependent oxidoreductase [Dokdonella sp.]